MTHDQLKSTKVTDRAVCMRAVGSSRSAPLEGLYLRATKGGVSAAIRAAKRMVSDDLCSVKCASGISRFLEATTRPRIAEADAVKLTIDTADAILFDQTGLRLPYGAAQLKAA